MYSSKSYAKANLFLNIIGKNALKYHLIESYFVLLDNIYDDVTVEPSDDLLCHVTGADIKDNIAIKAAMKLQQYISTTQGALIKIKKNIPIGAGLGGGSSNAATVLRLLNNMWHIGFTDVQLAHIAMEIGADVPFFIYNRNALVKGVGEINIPIILRKTLFLLLLNPKIYISTKEVFLNWKEKFSKIIAINDQVIIDNILNGKNDLSKTVVFMYPQIANLLANITKLPGCIAARITGTGSTCFGIFDNKEQLIKGYNQIKKCYPSYWSVSQILQL